MKVNLKDLLLYGLNGLARSLMIVMVYNMLLGKINYLYSNAISVILISVVSSIVNIKFVFRGKLSTKLLLIQLVLILKYMLISSFILALIVQLGISPRFGQLISIALLFPIWFLLTRYSIVRES